MWKRRNPPWSDLPTELLSTISNLINPNSIDILAFRSVCKSWYSSSPPVYPFILSTFLPVTPESPTYSFDIRFEFHKFGTPLLSVTAIFAIRQHSLDQITYIMFADQLTPAKFMIREPLSNRHYATPVNFPAYIDVPNVHVTEIGRFYNLNFQSEVNKPPSVWNEHVLKVVVNSDETEAVALFHTGQVGVSKIRTFAFGGGGKWQSLYTRGEHNLDGRIDDVVYYKGGILGVNHRCWLYDMVSEWGSRVIASGIYGCGGKRKRLVESNGRLYLVVRDGFNVCEENVEVVEFTVFEFNEVDEKWVEVSSVGGRVLFFGLNFSFSVSSQELGGSFGKDCVVFQEGSFEDYHGSGVGVGANDDNNGNGDEDGDGETDGDVDIDGDDESDDDGDDDNDDESDGDVDVDGDDDDASDDDGDDDNDDESDGDGDEVGDEDGANDDETAVDHDSDVNDDGDEVGDKDRADDDDTVVDQDSDVNDDGDDDDIGVDHESDVNVDGDEVGDEDGANDEDAVVNQDIDANGDASDDTLLRHLRCKDLPIGVWHMEAPCHTGKIASYPGCSELLWPPPSWLWPIDISKRIVDLEAALDDILVNAPAEKLKAMSNDLSLEQVIVKEDIANQDGDSEIWRRAHIMKKCLYKAKDFHNHLERVKANDVSRPKLCEPLILQNQAGSSYSGTDEGQQSVVNTIQNASEHSETRVTSLSDGIKIDRVIFHLEEIMTKLQNKFKSLQQPAVDAVE